MLSRRVFAYSLPLALACALLSGCKTTSEQKPEVDLPDKFTTGSTQPMRTDLQSSSWWEEFNDPNLTSLVKRGLDSNLSLMQARERLGIADIRAVVAGANALPSVAATSNAGRASTDDTYSLTAGNTVTASLRASWLVDLFGGTRSAQEGAEASRDAAAADLRAVRLAYIAAIASTYIDLQYFRRALDISRENLASYSQTLALTEEMRGSGVANNLDVAQAQALVDGAKAEVPALEREMHRASNRIATLLAIPASDFLGSQAMKGGQPRLKRAPEVGVPADLLRNRPDVQREERVLAAAGAEIGVAEAQLYPSLSLSGNIDITRFITSGLSVTTLAWAFGPSIVAPLLDGGRAQANVDIAKAQTRLQYLRWKETVLRAVEDVENALVAVHHSRVGMNAYTRKVASYSKTLELARESYKGGTSVLLDVLEADRSLGKSRLDLAESVRRMASDYVNLNIALGGGASVGEWQPPAEVKRPAPKVDENSRADAS